MADGAAATASFITVGDLACPVPGSRRLYALDTNGDEGLLRAIDADTGVCSEAMVQVWGVCWG